MNTNTTIHCRPRVLTGAGVADLLEVSERHLADVRKEDPTFPPPRMVGTLPRWTDTMIFAWLDSASAPAAPAAPTAKRKKAATDV